MPESTKNTPEYQTVNRGMLLRRALAGRLEAKCRYSMTDDYAFDNANNFGKMDDFAPVSISENWRDSKPDHVWLYPGCFKGKSGGAYKKPGSDDITLRVHSNLVYTVRILPKRSDA